MRNLCPYGHMHAKLVPSHMMPDACLTAWLHVFGFLFLPMLSAHSQAKNRLCGDGTLALCLWIAERRMTQEALAVHECTSAFDTGLFLKYLPMYSVHQPEDEDNDNKLLHLSPHMFGWPMFRPRLYTVLCHRHKCVLSGFSTALKSLFCKPQLQVHNLFIAPEEEIEEQRRLLSKKLFKSPNSTFSKLLTGLVLWAAVVAVDDVVVFWQNHYVRLSK